MVISKLLIRNMASSEGEEGFSIGHLQERSFPYPLFYYNQSYPERLVRYLESNLAASSAISPGFLGINTETYPEPYKDSSILSAVVIVLRHAFFTQASKPGGRRYLLDPDRNRLALRIS